MPTDFPASPETPLMSTAAIFDGCARALQKYDDYGERALSQISLDETRALILFCDGARQLVDLTPQIEEAQSTNQTRTEKIG